MDFDPNLLLIKRQWIFILPQGLMNLDFDLLLA